MEAIGKTEVALPSASEPRYETPMKQTVKMLNVKGNEPQTVKDVRAALAALIEDIRSGDATVAEAEPIKEEINKRIKEISAQMESEKPKDKAALRLFFGK